MNLYGPVRADKGVGTGKATVTLSMKWEGVPVAPTTHTILVSDSAGGKALPVSSRLIRSLPHPDRTASLADVRYTPKGTLFAAGYPSGVVQLWDPISGKELRRIESPSVSRSSAKYASTPADFGTLFVPIAGRKAVRVETDPKRPWRTDYAGKVLVWDLTTGKSKPPVTAQPNCGVMRALVSPDGSRLITTEQAGGLADDRSLRASIRMTDTATGRSWHLADDYGMAVFSPDSERVYVAVRTSVGQKKRGGVLVFDRNGKPQAPLVPLGERQYSAPAFSADGKRLVVSAAKGGTDQPAGLRVFDLATGKVIAEFPSGGEHPFWGTSISPDGGFLVAADPGGATDGKIRVFDVAKRSIVLEHAFAGMALDAPFAFSKDGRRLAVPARVPTDEDDSRDPDPRDYPQPRVYLFDLTKPKSAPEEIVCPHGWTGAVAFSPDGKTLAVGSAEAVHLFDVSGPAK